MWFEQMFGRSEARSPTRRSLPLLASPRERNLPPNDRKDRCVNQLSNTFEDGTLDGQLTFMPLHFSVLRNGAAPISKTVTRSLPGRSSDLHGRSGDKTYSAVAGTCGFWTNGVSRGASTGGVRHVPLSLRALGSCGVHESLQQGTEEGCRLS